MPKGAVESVGARSRPLRPRRRWRAHNQPGPVGRVSIELLDLSRIRPRHRRHDEHGPGGRRWALRATGERTSVSRRAHGQHRGRAIRRDAPDVLPLFAAMELGREPALVPGDDGVRRIERVVRRPRDVRARPVRSRRAGDVAATQPRRLGIRRDRTSRRGALRHGCGDHEDGDGREHGPSVARLVPVRLSPGPLVWLSPKCRLRVKSSPCSNAACRRSP